MRRLPPLNAVRAFEAAARHSSLTRAAEELHVTHGAISRQVALLEEWVGRPLFKRMPTQLVLTEAGCRYRQELTPVLDRLAVASLAARENAGAELRVKAPPTFTMRWLIPRIAGFQLKHPDITIRLSTATTPADLQGGDCDVFIHSVHAGHEKTTCHGFMNDFYVPACHVDLLAAVQAEPLRLLSGGTLISYATWPDGWTNWFEAAGVDPSTAPNDLRLEQMFFAVQAALEGLGTAIIPLALVLDDIVQGRLAVPFGLRGARHRPWLACTETARAVDPSVRAFLDWLEREGRDFECNASAWIESAGWADNPFRDRLVTRPSRPTS